MSKVLSDILPSSVNGEFNVQMSPSQPTGLTDVAPSIARYSLTKTYQGGLQGSASGEMLSAGQPRIGEASYVALESFTGSLEGKYGTFSLAHFGEMDKSGETLSINIVPGSGTGDLNGLRGHLQIRREVGKHFYTLSYWYV